MCRTVRDRVQLALFFCRPMGDGGVSNKADIATSSFSPRVNGRCGLVRAKKSLPPRPYWTLCTSPASFWIPQQECLPIGRAGQSAENNKQDRVKTVGMDAGRRDFWGIKHRFSNLLRACWTTEPPQRARPVGGSSPPALTLKEG